jgi:hypothetical protein
VANRVRTGNESDPEEGKEGEEKAKEGTQAAATPEEVHTTSGLTAAEAKVAAQEAIAAANKAIDDSAQSKADVGRKEVAAAQAVAEAMTVGEPQVDTDALARAITDRERDETGHIATLAESDEKGLKYVVSNFRITHDYRMPDGNTRTVAFNEGDTIIDNEGSETLPHDNIMALLKSGHIRRATAEDEPATEEE